jgi:aryl-alcohol dehydrogenase-like predicted oxidoreductase
MRYRELGDSGLQVSELCLGSWATYGRSVEAAQAEACIDTAFDVGINLIDTANVYADGRAEAFLGDVLSKRPRASYVLATKVYGEMPDGGHGLSRAQILEQVDASLSRLRTDYVDLYQAHGWDEAVPLEETLEAFTEVVNAGKARFIGVSNWSGEQIRRAVDLCRLHGYAKPVSSQPEYSLLHRDAERGLFAVCREHGISQIVWSPLAQGVLTGKYLPGEAFAAGTRATSPGRPGYMERYLADDILERVQRLSPIADRLGLTMAQLALAWALREPNLAGVIVGASRPEQIVENVAASGVELDASTLHEIDDVLA